MRVRIISEGTGPTTRVVDAETGEPIAGVVSVSWTCDGPDNVARATVELVDVAVDVVGEVEQLCSKRLGTFCRCGHERGHDGRHVCACGATH